MFKPFSNNLIFFDTEFSTNNPSEGEILSLAMIKMNGEELYLELEFSGDVHPWVKGNILPLLTAEKVSKRDAKNQILEFIGDTKPYLVTFVNQFDFVYLMKILDYHQSPFRSIPIDFASVMFTLGVDPDEYKQRLDHKFIRGLGIDMTKYKLHHALDDARLLKEVYMKLIDSSPEN